ncbi:putative nitrate regulatory gene2 protein [Cocos nucifera]|nr:putative nitrate regulatory gene2 protein [Cocos nucifera]
MGCAQSRVDNEEAVFRCRERKQWMKEAVTARNAFAAAHSAYAVALKNTGAALSEFGQGEVASAPASSSAVIGELPTAASIVPAVQPPMDTLLPPPPPLPDFSPSPLQRSISMPDLPHSKKFPSKSHLDASIREEEETAAAAEDDDGGGLEDHRRQRRPTAAGPSPSPSPPPPPMPESTWDYFFAMDENMRGPSLGHPEEIRPEREEALEESFKRSAPPSRSLAVDHDAVGADDDPPVTPEKVVLEPPLPPKMGTKMQKQGGAVHHQHAASAPLIDAKRGKMVAAAAPRIDLLQVLTDIDDHFLKASESAHEVSKMLEATRLHYHSNFADNRGACLFLFPSSMLLSF